MGSISAKDQFEALVMPEDPFIEEDRVFTPGRSQAEVAKELLRNCKGE